MVQSLGTATLMAYAINNNHTVGEHGPIIRDCDTVSFGLPMTVICVGEHGPIIRDCDGCLLLLVLSLDS
jgi:hypothetical protein